MIVRGSLIHLHTTTITTKRGSTQLTTLRVVDDHSRPQHGGQPGARHSPTRYEVQFVDSKLFQWSTAIQERFTVGDDLLVYAEDTIRVQGDKDGASTLVVYGIDVGHATQPFARRVE